MDPLTLLVLVALGGCVLTIFLLASGMVQLPVNFGKKHAFDRLPGESEAKHVRRSLWMIVAATCCTLGTLACVCSVIDILPGNSPALSSVSGRTVVGVVGASVALVSAWGGGRVSSPHWPRR